MSRLWEGGANSLLRDHPLIWTYLCVPPTEKLLMCGNVTTTKELSLVLLTAVSVITCKKTFSSQQGFGSHILKEKHFPPVPQVCRERNLATADGAAPEYRQHSV